MIDSIGNKSLAQGFYRYSRLPKFSLLEKLEIRDAYDFIAINYYTSELATAGNDTERTEISFQSDCDVRTYKDPSWEGSAASWLKVSVFYTFTYLYQLQRTYKTCYSLRKVQGLEPHKIFNCNAL